MQLTSFQPPELRDAQNNIIQEGTYSVKNGVLANAQNTGVLDYINNNLQTLQNNVVSLQSSSLVWEYVDQLPTPSDANPNAIYAVPQTDEQGNRYYIEYRLINGTWQVFGSTKVDITQAVMKADVLDSIRADSTLPVQSKAILNALNEKPNVDDVYTKAETNSLLNNKANSSDLNNYLAKSGGVLTGAEIRRNVDNNNIIIRGCTASSKGARLVMYGQDSTEFAGIFDIQAYKSGVGTYSLSGTPQGSLTWGNKEILRVESSGTDYIRYTDGLQICWGTTNVSFNNSTMASNGSTFPQPFKQTPMVLGTNASGSSTYSFEISATLTTTSCSFMAVNRGGAITVTNRSIYWIAIGRWK